MKFDPQDQIFQHKINIITSLTTSRFASKGHSQTGLLLMGMTQDSNRVLGTSLFYYLIFKKLRILLFFTRSNGFNTLKLHIKMLDFTTNRVSYQLLELIA